MKIGKYIKKSELFNHSKNYLIGDFFTKALGFISIPIFTRLLSTGDYGILALFTSAVSIFSIIYSLNFSGSISRKYYELGNDFNEYYYSNYIFIIIYSSLLTIPLFVFRHKIGSFFGISGTLFSYVITICIFSISVQLYLSYLRASKQSSRYAKFNFLQSVSTLTLSIILVYLLVKSKYLGKVYAGIVISLIFSLIAYFNMRKVFTKRFSFSHVKYALLFGVPLIPHTLSSIILAQFDRIVINQYYGTSDTGLYSFAYNVGMIMSVVIGATHKAWSPIFYEKMAKKEYQNINKTANNYMKIVFLIAYSLIIFSRELIMVLADKKFYQALDIVPIIILGYVFVYLYNLYSAYAFYYKKTLLISLFTLISGIINIILNYIFVPKFGYQAAAYTTVFSYFIYFILHYINSKYIIKANIIPIKYVIKNIFVLAVFCFFFIFVNSYNINHLLLLLYKIILLAVLFYVSFFNKVNELFSKNISRKL